MLRNDFKQFSKFRTHLISKYSGTFSVYRPRDLERTIRILWMQSKSRPYYVTEPIFVKLLNTASLIRSVNASVADNVNGYKERNSGYENMSQPRPVTLDSAIVKRVFYRMTIDLGLKGQSFRPVLPSVARDSMPGSSSSSVPDFITPKSSNFEHVSSQLEYWIKTGDISFFNSYMIGVSWRTQVSRSMKLKFRQFYPLPHLVQLAERTIFDGIFRHFDKNRDTPYAYANIFPDLQKRWLHWQKSKYIYAFDLEAFDQRISNVILGHIFNFCLIFLKLNTYEYRLFRQIEMYHMNALICTSLYETSGASGVTVVYNKRCGLLSGSTLTNLFGSLVNLFQLYYYMFDNKLSICPKSLSVHGDDCILAMDKLISIDNIASYFMSKFNCVISIDKSEIFFPNQRIYYLGHFFDNNGRYINERWKLQLSLSESFISTDVLPTEQRIYSKFISLLSKCTDGFKIFYEYQQKLNLLLNIPETPSSVVNLSEGTVLYRKRVEVSRELIINGWKTQ
jgi:hypothetical protein